MIQFKLLKKQEGYLLLVSVILIMMIGFIGSVIAYMSAGSSSGTIQLQLADQAFYIAESGLEEASRYYLSKGIACNTITNDTDLTNASVGNGKFTVTGTLYTGTTTLSSAITSSATTIPVNSTTGFAPSGFLSIEGEAMTYANISGNSFIGVMRGYKNTTPASHAINISVTQNQCVLDSIAGVPSLSSPKAKRELIKNISPQAATTYYAVGDSNGTIETILRYNGTTWVAISPSISGSIDLFDVSLSSATTGWAVGASNNLYQLSGGSWNLVTTSLSAGIYTALICLSPSNCLTMGNSKKTGVWDGTTWSQTNLPGGVPTIPNILGLHCDSSTNCWAVGTNTGTKFFQGTGTPLSWTAVSASGLSAFSYNDVFCNSANDCWAVGANATFARKSGANWANFATGMPATQYNGVFCTSSSNCWAVGNSVGTSNTLVQWNGTSWSRYIASNPIPSANFNSVACSKNNDCWAVGGTAAGGTAFIYYNGSTWSAVSPASMPAVILRGVGVFGAGSGGGGTAWVTWYEKFS